MDDMMNNKWRFDAPEGKIGGYLDAKGRYMIGEGHHRMRAAIESGNSVNVQNLLNNGRWTPVERFPITIRILSLLLPLNSKAHRRR